MKNKIFFSTFLLMFIALLSSPQFVYCWEKCGVYKIGYNKSHFSNQGQWCPNGYFITQLDLDGGGYGGDKMGNYPIVGNVTCCKPSGTQGYLPVKRTPRSGKSDAGGVTREDIRLIWQQIDEILSALEGHQ
ncbi:hypothetical protein [Desulforhopalus singaporensis]|uniref:hypothetical protein n=1 Tax=Desulforhopalus singaporensis TaxID=91360 RepID=UPI00115FA9FD|nr:hypothetical protein [Desulforhopalus singaporensis]